MRASLQSTVIFQKNWEAYQKRENRLVINEGGTGSSKTYSLAQLFVLIMMRERGVQLTIARKTFPSLRATAMRDFFNVAKGLGVYREDWHNKSENIFRYMPTKSEVDFISVDEPIKVRSRRRHYLWLNEANEFGLEDFEQLNMRTERQIYMDYNPSHQFHWIYDSLQQRSDCVVIPSTYQDNPFLAEELVKEIEGYKGKDQNYWRVYGLGLKGFAEALVYTHWEFCDDLPEAPDKVCYGLDFGYNNPSALVEIVMQDQDCYCKEKLYERYLTNVDLIGKFVQLGISKNVPIYADSAEPARIEELKRAGFYAIPSVKIAIKDGIDLIKSRKLYVTKSSVGLLKELKFYSWKMKDSKNLDEPVKESDHACDALRYGVVGLLGGKRFIFV